MSSPRNRKLAPPELPADLARAALEAAGSVVFVTGRDGTIIWVNEAFSAFTGWSPEEAIGQNPRILQSGLHDRHYYARLWSEITRGHCFSSRVVNRRRDGALYTVAQTVTPLPRGSANPTHFVAFQEDVSAEVEAARELEYLAYTDTLTGLGNRRSLMERLDEVWRRREPVALLLMDMDDFKGINDRYGHEEGDEALRRIARMFRDEGLGHSAYRLGGDEFVVVLNGADARDVSAAEGRAWAVRSAVVARNSVAAGSRLSLSAGLAFAPAHARDSSSLLRAADLALARAKASRSGVEVYTAALGRAAARDMAIRQDLERAMAGGGLSLAYQPIRSLNSGATVALEVLLRWHHPRYGEIAPAEFIPVAERSGQIGALGDWTLARALRYYGRELRHSGIRLHVNVSPYQLRDALFASRLARLLAAERLPGNVLDIEVTESAELQGAGAGEVLEAVGRLGVGVIIDDFGAGFARLGSLADLPLTGLKLDRGLVTELTRSRRHRELLAGIIGLAHSSGLRVIGEGVETPDEAELLRSIGCDEGQGYYFGAPHAGTLREPVAS